jgi:hypothetical protein
MARDVLSEVDHNRDGKVDYTEFVNMMQAPNNTNTNNPSSSGTTNQPLMVPVNQMNE